MLDFSFSGLKTSVKYFLQDKGPEYIAVNRALICKSFQNSLVESLAGNLQAASQQTNITTIAVVGGVACNAQLRQRLGSMQGISVYFPSPVLCTDNAAMIARAGHEREKRGMLRFPHMAPSAKL
jgi:N6-L-threonylcarbamoyladenine synthase